MNSRVTRLCHVARSQDIFSQSFKAFKIMPHVLILVDHISVIKGYYQNAMR